MPIKIGAVLSCAPEAVVIAIDNLEVFEKNKETLQVGRFLKIAQGNHDFTIATIRNIKGAIATGPDGKPVWSFQIECQAIGTLVDDKSFDRGSLLLPVPTEHAFIADADTLDKIFSKDGDHDFPLGKLSMNKDIDLMINGNRFFSKHIAVVGSTGSGKSCTVASVLQGVVGIAQSKNNNKGTQNNSHIVIFDIHDEYTAAFTLDKEQSFTLSRLDIDSLQLPYWLMNSEKLESMFIESNEANSHNQVSQFKHAVVLNKEKHNPGIKEVTYDTPVYFSIQEVYRFIENLNREVIGRLANEDKPKLVDGTLVEDRKIYFDKIYDFAANSSSKDAKATNGPFNGEFNRFVSRLEAKLSDKRLRFLLDAKKADGQAHVYRGL